MTGLFQEYEIDKTLGIKGPEDVEKMGIAAYNAECRKIVMRYSTEWEVSELRVPVKKLLKELLAVCCHMKINVVHVLLCYLIKCMHWTFYEFHINLFNKRLYSINKNIIKF